MRTMNRLEQPFRGAMTLQEQINRVFGDVMGRAGEESNLTPWAPAVDIYETEHELVVKADLPDMNPQDLDIRVENNILTIRGERKFENKVSEDNYLRVERAYGSFSRSFSLANSVKFGGNQSRLSEWRANAKHPEERGSKAEADQGECGNAGHRGRGRGSLKRPQTEDEV